MLPHHVRRVRHATCRLITEYAPIVRFLPSCLRWVPNEDVTIKERLAVALAQHKDASEADPVRESEERTKKELAEVKRELETKIDKLTDMIQTLLDNQQS